LSCSALENTGIPTPIEIMMAELPEDICLFTCIPQSPGDTWQLQSFPAPKGGCWSPSDMWWPQSYPELRGHVAAPVLPQATGARGGPGATLSREREPEPRGHMVASELPSAGRRESLS
jgi:hypothetical protein